MRKIVYRIVMSGIMLSILGTVTYSLHTAFFKNYSFSIHFDPLFSQQACQEMHAWLQASRPIYMISSLIHILQKQFPSIKSASYARRSRGSYDIVISAQRPAVMWGTKYVITDQALCLSQADFAWVYCAHLPRVISEKKSDPAPHRLCRELLTVAQELFQNYTVTWHDNSCVMMQPTQQSDCIILGHDASFLDLTKLKQASDLCLKNNLKRTKKDLGKKYIYDIRFENQILEYVMKGKWNDTEQCIV